MVFAAYFRCLNFAVIFNVENIFPYKVDMDKVLDVEAQTNEQLVEVDSIETPQIECILTKRLSKKTRKENHYDYLVKWKNQPVVNAT